MSSVVVTTVYESPSAVAPLNVQRYVTPFLSVESEAVRVNVFWFVSAPIRPATEGFGAGAVASSSQFTVVASLSLPALSTAMTLTE